MSTFHGLQAGKTQLRLRLGSGDLHATTELLDQQPLSHLPVDRATNHTNRDTESGRVTRGSPTLHEVSKDRKSQKCRFRPTSSHTKNCLRADVNTPPSSTTETRAGGDRTARKSTHERNETEPRCTVPRKGTSDNHTRARVTVTRTCFDAKCHADMSGRCR